ncbi:MAG: hypothetical protein ACRCVG_01005 [Methanobacteriaceae archaeon]
MKDEKSDTLICYSHNTILDNFYERADYQHFNLIGNIIDVESPIHKNEIYDRVKKIYNLKATKKFKNHMDYLLDNMSISDMVIVKGDFCYNNEMCEITIRKREKPNIDLICYEEIKETILQTLKEQYSLDIESLSKSSSELLGFSVFRGKTKDKYFSIINKMVLENEIKFIEFSNRLELV